MRGPDIQFSPRSLEGMLKAGLCLVCVLLFGFIYEHCRLSTYLVASPFCRLNWHLHSANHFNKSIAYVYQILYDDEESALYEEG